MTALAKLSAKIIANSRGDKTIKVFAWLTNGKRGSASVPQGKSVGKYEASYVKPETAARNVEKIILPQLKNRSVFDQEKIDKRLNKKWGANATLGVSFAVARAAAQARNMPLWRYIRNLYGKAVNKPMGFYMNLIEGGVHAKNKLFVQEFLAIFREKTLAKSLVLGKRFYKEVGRLARQRYRQKIALGDEGGFALPENDDFAPLNLYEDVRLMLKAKVSYGIDAAASGVKKTVRELTFFYKQMIANYPISYIEDPYNEENFKNFASLTKRYGRSVFITGDDLTVTNPDRVKKAHRKRSVNGIIIKPNQIGTLTETLEVIRLAQDWKWNVVVSHRSGETDDDFVADLAWAVGADGVKFGAPKQKERLVKYRRLCEIEKSSIDVGRR